MTFIQFCVSKLIGAPAKEGNEDGRSWWLCPFHDDHEPSFCTLPIVPGKSAAVGGYFKCFSPACEPRDNRRERFGDAVQFLKDLRTICHPSVAGLDLNTHAAIDALLLVWRREWAAIPRDKTPTEWFGPPKVTDDGGCSDGDETGRGVTSRDSLSLSRAEKAYREFYRKHPDVYRKWVIDRRAREAVVGSDLEHEEHLTEAYRETLKFIVDNTGLMAVCEAVARECRTFGVDFKEFVTDQVKFDRDMERGERIKAMEDMYERERAAILKAATEGPTPEPGDWE